VFHRAVGQGGSLVGWSKLLVIRVVFPRRSHPSAIGLAAHGCTAAPNPSHQMSGKGHVSSKSTRSLPASAAGVDSSRHAA